MKGDKHPCSRLRKAGENKEFATKIDDSSVLEITVLFKTTRVAIAPTPLKRKKDFFRKECICFPHQPQLAKHRHTLHF
jgi:hypothetical protein